MSNTPTYRILREAIISIKESWPDSASWPELLDLEEILSREVPDSGAPLPVSAREPVEEVLRRLAEELGARAARPLTFVIKPCELLASWAGFGSA